jgi:hypothetical protein
MIKNTKNKLILLVTINIVNFCNEKYQKVQDAKTSSLLGLA